MIAGASVLLPNDQVEKYKVGEVHAGGKVTEIRHAAARDGVEVSFSDGEYLVFPWHRVMMIHVKPEEVKHLDE